MTSGFLRPRRILALAFAAAVAAPSRAVPTPSPEAPAPSGDILPAAIRDAGAKRDYERLRELFRDRLEAVQVIGVSNLTLELLGDPLDFEQKLSFGDMGGLADTATLADVQLTRFRDQFGLGMSRCNSGDPGQRLAAAEDPPQRLATMFASAAASVLDAFGEVTEGERKGFLVLLEQMLREATGEGNGDDGETKAFADALSRLVAHVDYGALDCAMRELAAMTDRAILEALRSWAETAGPTDRPDWLDPRITGDLLWAASTVHGVFVIGAAGPNIYGAPAAAIIDVGGDDLYLGQGGRELEEIAGKAGVVIDLAGNDRYLTNGDVSAGAAVMGAALLFDAGGDDTYLSRRIGQGAGIVGHGVVVDFAGNDLYALDTFGQGAALAGTGLAWDGSGSDRWSAALLAQGSGGPLGLGVLVDRAGDDVFRAGNLYPSSYGTPGIFQALAQGSGWGIRPALGGGIGLLEDNGGDDTYLAGNFSQGTGYLGGTGVLRDHEGEDRYLGSRYSQGTAAHLAAGILVDDTGGDRYRAEVAANQGAGWDLGVGILLDREGDDEYAGADLSQGSAAQNGMGFLLDFAGSDNYEASGNGQGYSGLLTYGGGRGAGNLAVFVGREEGGSRRSVVNGQPIASVDSSGDTLK